MAGVSVSPVQVHSGLLGFKRLPFSFAAYRARRLDWIPEMLEVKSFAASASSRAIIVTVPAYCKVISLKIPFIDLFVAPDRLRDCPWADRPPQPSLTMPRRR